MRPGFPQPILLCLGFCIFIALHPLKSRAAESHEVESITVLADSRLAVPLSEIVSRFAQESAISVAAVFGDNADQQKKIEDGEPADIFIVSDKERIESLRNKGLVDIHSVKPLAAEGETHFTAAVIASENMNAAREFMKYLKSDEAKQFFRKNGLTAP